MMDGSQPCSLFLLPPSHLQPGLLYREDRQPKDHSRSKFNNCDHPARKQAPCGQSLRARCDSQWPAYTAPPADQDRICSRCEDGTEGMDGGDDGRGLGAATVQAVCRRACRRLVNTTRDDTERCAVESKFQPQCNYPPRKRGVPSPGTAIHVRRRKINSF